MVNKTTSSFVWQFRQYPVGMPSIRFCRAYHIWVRAKKSLSSGTKPSIYTIYPIEYAHNSVLSLSWLYHLYVYSSGLLHLHTTTMWIIWLRQWEWSNSERYESNHLAQKTRPMLMSLDALYLVQLDYSDVTWAWWRLESPTNRLFVQSITHSNNTEHGLSSPQINITNKISKN